MSYQNIEYNQYGNCNTATPAETVTAWLSRGVNNLFNLSYRYQQRRELLALDDRMLKDIGITRSDAEAEGYKPFWRD